MDETRETGWESLRNEDRIELCLVQIDIVEHSKIRENSLAVKTAKGIFSDEIKSIASAHEGKLFDWAGDGGIFQFLTKDGKGFIAAVTSALEMLASMPAINKRIADKTDLKEPLRIRLSCDSGIGLYDQDSSRIHGDFISHFIKNERKISLADTICITERVYKELEPQLRARFSFYKHSPEIRADIYKLTRSKSPLRSKQVVLLSLIGIALAFACGVVLGKYVWGKDNNGRNDDHARKDGNACIDNNVRIVGGGTVYYYLMNLDPSLSKNLSDSTQLNILPVQAPTDVGAQIFAHNFEPITNQPNLLNVTILVMASRQLKIEDLSRAVPSKEGSKTRPEAVFEVYLGADPLEVLLVTANAHANLKAEVALNQDFPDIMLTESVRNSGSLTFTELATILNSSRNKAPVYTGVPKSATRCLWSTRLKDKKGNHYSMDRTKPWDIQAHNMINERSDEPGIYLGSTALIDEEEGRGIKPHRRRLPMVDESNNKVKRGLYLYGFLDKSDANKTPDGKGYKLPEYVTKILKYVFDVLGEKRDSISKSCLDQQREYFHLNEGWVEAVGDKTVYRADACGEQPKELVSTCDENPKK